MATPATTNTTSKTNTDPLADYRKKVQETAAKTRDTGIPQIDTSSLRKQAQAMTGNPTYGYDQTRLAGALVDQTEREMGAQQQRAEKAASALETVGESTLRGVEQLSNIQTGVRASTNSAQESFNAAAEKADEYVQAARARVGETLSRLDAIHKDFESERSFAKAHSMQAATQSVLGSMKAEERNIAQTYGANSPEMAQFRQQKQSALATVQSNIEAQYQQLAEAQHNTYLSTVSDVATKQNMYLGFQEQQHVEMLKFMDNAKQQYKLQAAELDVGIETLKMNQMENLANWIIETPAFTMDMTPVVTLMSSMIATEKASADASYSANKNAEAIGGGGGFDLGGLAGGALGSMFGGVGASLGSSLGSKLTGGGKSRSTVGTLSGSNTFNQGTA